MRRLPRDRWTAPRTRHRLAIVWLAALSSLVPAIVRHLETHERTVRNCVKGFLLGCFATLPDHPRSGRPTVSAADVRAVVRLPDGAAQQRQIWPMPGLARGSRWRCTKPTVRHKRADPAH